MMHIGVLEALTTTPRASIGGLGHQNNGHCCFGLTGNHRVSNGLLGHQNKAHNGQ